MTQEPRLWKMTRLPYNGESRLFLVSDGLTKFKLGFSRDVYSYDYIRDDVEITFILNHRDWDDDAGLGVHEGRGDRAWVLSGCTVSGRSIEATEAVEVLHELLSALKSGAVRSYPPAPDRIVIRDTVLRKLGVSADDVIGYQR